MDNKFKARIDNLRALFEANGIDALYISKPEDVSYFTGTKGDDICLYIAKNDSYIITDFRYRELAESISWFKYYELNSNNSVLDLIKSLSDKRLGVCFNSLELSTYLDFVNISDKDIILTGDKEYSLVNELRAIKDEEEIEYIHKAEEIGSEAFNHILSFIKEGMTEKEIALELEHYMLTHGADGISFDTICISGEKTSMPHGVPSDKKVKKGEFITMDYGCTYKGYHSDMTRTIALGYASDEMKHIYDIVLKAQLNACNNLKAGLKGSDCHQLAADIIAEEGFGDAFGHGLGHGVGLEIHESPRLSPVYDKTIPVNSVVSVEPGIYLAGKFGVRIEDLAVVKENGIINITSAPKELIII